MCFFRINCQIVGQEAPDLKKPENKLCLYRYLVEKMAYNNGGTIMPYPQQGNGYTLQPVPNFNQRPNNVRKVGKHEDEEAGKLFVGGLR